MVNHYWQVTKHKIWVAWFLLQFAFCIIWRAVSHDFSKYGRVEAPLFSKVLPKLAKLTYDSSEYRAILREIEPALTHHYAENRHHPEHFGSTGIKGMNLVDVVEMFCDWRASVKRHEDGNLQKSIQQNSVRFDYSADIEIILQNSK